jgi:hypothetical protein
MPWDIHMSKRKQILKQMFDVRPVQEDGTLDMGKIKRLQKTVHISKDLLPEKETTYIRFSDIRSTREISRGKQRKKKHLEVEKVFFEIETAKSLPARQPNIIQLGKNVSHDLLSVSSVLTPKVFLSREKETPKEISNEEISDYFTEYPGFSETEKEGATKAFFSEKGYEDPIDGMLKGLETKRKKQKRRKELRTPDKKIKLSFSRLFSSSEAIGPRFGYAFSLIAALLVFSLLIPGFSLIQKAFNAKDSVTLTGQEAFSQFAQAKDNMASGNLSQASVNFEQSYEILNSAQSDISEIGGGFSDILRFIPGASKVATANYVVAAGKNLALSGKYLTESADSLSQIKNPLKSDESGQQASLTEIFLKLQDGVEKSSVELNQAQENLGKANPDDLPEELRPQFLELKEKLPVVTASLKGFLDYSQIFLDVLGYNGPRKFLFLFQNNQEMRATGGFIGSYGVLDISNGRIKELFVDDIYNPDGQLKAKVIPPEPIQKMSAVWTMHDANWFPDFPTSAEKVAWFYEKTGGPTVDGIISITPSLLQNLLEITGPIEMPEYDTTVDKDNFIEKTQYEVEVDYDKDLNKPKKFIADLTPKILDKVFSTRDLGKIVKILEILNKSLKEKHLLLYSKNYNIQKLISAQGWSGEILNTRKDYLSVINTNINGYKTDGVIDENIEHASEIQSDGSIIDSVTVTRKHNGGNSDYDWWNKVNSDYMRVYVPEDSVLLEASGQTRETVSAPLDYQSLGFKKDPQLQMEDDSMRVDEETGTRIYKENHKTVFANWTYVSPGETMILKYKYRLPFKLEFDSLHHPADSFSVLYQKQSGSPGSKLTSEIKIPDNYRLIWRWPDDSASSQEGLKMETVLNADRFVGLALEKN